MAAHENHGTRLGDGDLEIGYTEALRKHVSRHIAPPPPVSQRKLDFEHRRPRILQECVAEATGVFFYVFLGLISVAALTLNSTSPVLPIFSSLLQIGLAFGFGITLAIIVCSPVSGGHFNPGVTLCFAIWKGFPWRKVPHYILSQILGSFLAGIAVMGCYWPQIQALKAANVKTYSTAVYNGGAASILCSFPPATQTNQGYLFLQEFLGTLLLSIVIWACLDPANDLKSPISLPYTIGLAYAVVIWGFGSQALSMNTARDFGTRIVAAIFFGKEAFTQYNSFCWIPILVNIPAYITGAAFYEYLFQDSLHGIGRGHSQHEEGQDGVMRHLGKIGVEVPRRSEQQVQYKGTMHQVESSV